MLGKPMEWLKHRLNIVVTNLGWLVNSGNLKSDTKFNLILSNFFKKFIVLWVYL